MTTILIKSNYTKLDLEEWEDRCYGPYEFPLPTLEKWHSYRVALALPNRVKVFMCPNAVMQSFIDKSTEGVDYLILY